MANELSTVPAPEKTAAAPAAAKNEDPFPEIDLLTLAEERATSAPIADFGVIFLAGWI